jgi:hypothetical protein
MIYRDEDFDVGNQGLGKTLTTKTNGNGDKPIDGMPPMGVGLPHVAPLRTPTGGRGVSKAGAAGVGIHNL